MSKIIVSIAILALLGCAGKPIIETKVVETSMAIPKINPVKAMRSTRTWRVSTRLRMS